MNVLSLFDGISCGRVALEKAGISVENYFASEVDPHAITVAKNQWGEDVTEIGDVRDINSTSLPKIDLLIGGSPCQNFSMAGKRNGMTTIQELEVTSLEQYLNLKNENFEFDGFSYLFWEYVRILKEVKPKYFFLENVKMSNKWKNLISEVLGVEPVAINSQLVSAQKRERYYWTNIPNIEQPKDKGLLLKDVLLDTYSEKEYLTPTKYERFHFTNATYSVGSTKSKESTSWGQRDVVYGSYDKIGCLMASDEREPKYVIHNKILRKISPEEAELLQTLPIGYTSGIPNRKRFHAIGNGWTVDVIAHCFKNIA